MRRPASWWVVLAAAFLLGACAPGEVIQGAPVSGDPVPAAPPVLTVAPICLGVPFLQCKQMAESMAQEPGPGGAPVARITVRCKGVCTPLKGEGETRVDYADGSTLTSGWGYESAGG